MRMFHIRKPSPALVISIIALLVALGGTAYAGVTIPNNSVGTRQLQNGAVTTSKIKNGAVTKSKINTSGLTVPSAANAAALGGAGPSSYEQRVQWALVAADGTIISQSGGISVSATDGSGGYYLDFHKPTTGKAITVSLSNVDEAYGGTPQAVPCGGGTGAARCDPTGTNDSDHLFVFTSSPTNSGAGANHAFYITVIS